MNIPAILSLFRVARDPSLCLPHATVSTFADLPIPLSRAFGRSSAATSRTRFFDREKNSDSSADGNDEEVDIRAVVLDKDNCFAVPHTDEVFPAYSAKFTALLSTYSPSNILIVSNSSGTLSKDPLGTAADTLERNTGVKVLRHSQMKPACGEEIMAHFRSQSGESYNDADEKQERRRNGMEVTKPSQICVVGDRLFTDVVMANMMGARAIWIKNGVVQDRGVVTRVEYGVEGWLRNRGWTAKDAAA